MGIKIQFDVSHNPENPTLVLANRNGNKLGLLKAQGISIKDCMNDAAEISFTINKYYDNKKYYLWEKIKDFKLVWWKEQDIWFEIRVELDEATEVVKTVYCTQLGQAELSQILLHNIEINTEDDISRDDYIIPTVLYRTDNLSASLLHRIMEKAPHYSIIHVDDSIANIQRTFQFDNISIYDAMQEIAKEIGCLFVFHSNSDIDGKIQRTISVYDLQSVCNDCNYRGEFTSECPECGSKNINEGYGTDTNIFITSDELADDIQLTTDVNSVKNCFKLEAGDDLMTATIRNCNPNGTDYIWYISPDLKEDMSNELVKKLVDYNNLYNYYQKEYSYSLPESLLTSYNDLVIKYQSYNSELSKLSSPLIGYSGLMIGYYNTIDFALFLQSGLMPNIETSETNAATQAALLTSQRLSPIAAANMDYISETTADNLVLSMAKLIVGAGYKVRVNTSNLTIESWESNNRLWTGNFIVSNYSDEEDTVISNTVSIIINDNYETYIKQKVEKELSENITDNSISSLFELDYSDFCTEIKSYSLERLSSFHDACQSCIDILIEQGVSDSKTWSGVNPNLYIDLYQPYYQKLLAIESEIKIREDEIAIILGKFDSDGDIKIDGLQTIIISEKNRIQNLLNFQNFIGENLWLEFCTYRREDKYSNSNYISDGLNNSELFKQALDFIKIAQNEIYKSAELQHSITSSLRNLLVIKKFLPLVNYFEVGNWIRVKVDDNIYKLRLLDYQIDFDTLEKLSVTFSDVIKVKSGINGGITDIQSVISQASSMASSYDSIKRQANQGAKSQNILNDWFANGMSATNTKIVGDANNQEQTWDKHGMLFRQYNPVTESYSDIQLKIINSTIAITDDGWKTTKTAIGNFFYTNPQTGEMKSAYGINGETVIGKLMIGEGLGIYNEAGSLTFDNNGFIVSNNKNSVIINPNNTSIFNIKNNTSGNVLSFDENGNLIIIGDITARSLTLLSGATVNANKINGLSDVAISGKYEDLIDIPIFANVAKTGNYNDLKNLPDLFSGNYDDLSNKPEIPKAVDISGKFDNPINHKNAVTGMMIVKTEDGSIWQELDLSGYLKKQQSESDIGKFLYVDENMNIIFITIEEIKKLLGITTEPENPDSGSTDESSGTNESGADITESDGV